MVRKLGLLLTVLASVAIADAAIAQDAGSALRAAARAMGAPDGLNSIEYSGTGWVAGVGQSYTPADDWPRREVSAYTRVIDYADRSSREEITRRQGEYGIRGGSLPVVGEEKQVFLTNGHHAWNVAGANAVPQPALAEIRQLDIWTSPHGFLQAAMEHDATATPLVLEGRKVTIVSFQLGKYRVNGTINEEDLVERVQTWVPNPVLGDMVYEHRYTDYRDFGGVKFPTVPALTSGRSQCESDAQLDGDPRDGRARERGCSRVHRPRQRRGGHSPSRGRRVPGAGTGSLVDRGWEPPQRRGRVPGLHRRRRGPAERGTLSRRHRRGAKTRPEQADQLRGQYPSSFRPLRGAPHVCSHGRDCRHARRKPRILQERVLPSWPADTRARPSLNAVPLVRSESGSCHRRGQNEVRIERRYPDDGPLCDRRSGSYSEHDRRLSPDGEDSDQRGSVRGLDAGLQASGAGTSPFATSPRIFGDSTWTSSYTLESTEA